MPVDTLILKLVATPILIGAASLAGRRWGQIVGGWFVGLPLTSGPVAFFLALDHGAGFAAAAAVGSLLGAVGEAAFCHAYARAARRLRWPAALGCACVAFAAVAVAFQRATLPLPVLVPGVLAVLAGVLRLLPRGVDEPRGAPAPRWDVPARMVITTALVLGLTGAAPVLGPRVSGVLAAFPVYAAILTVFAHRSGPAPAIQVLRGLLLGLFAFTGFFVVLGGSIERIGIAAAFAAAVVTALAIQAATFGLAVKVAARRA
jgi:hypothetical protein